MKLSHVFSWIGVGIFCVAWNISIAPFLPGVRWVEPFLPLLVFLVLFRPLGMGLLFGSIVALFMDLYQLSDIPGMTFFAIGYVLILSILSNRILTNRSFYSAFVLLLLGRGIAFMIGFFSAGSVGMWNPATIVPFDVVGVAWRVLSDIALLLIPFLFSSRFQRTIHSSPTAGGLIGYY